MLITESNHQEKTKPIYLSKNINYLLNINKIDVKNLSMATGLPPATISRLRRSDTNPTISSLMPLASFFRVDMDALLFKDLSDRSNQINRSLGELVHIPVIAMEELDKWPCKSIIERFVGAAGIPNDNVFGVMVDSNALAPIFQSKSILIIDPDIPPKEGDYVICYLDGDKKAKFRQVFTDGNSWFFKPLNPKFGEIKQHADFKITGTIIKSLWKF